MGNSTCTEIQIINDNVLESDETFKIMLVAVDSNMTFITAASSFAIVTIVEDNIDCKFKEAHQYYLTTVSYHQ